MYGVLHVVSGSTLSRNAVKTKERLKVLQELQSMLNPSRMAKLYAHDNNLIGSGSA